MARRAMTPFQRKIVHDYMSGKTIKQIAKEQERSPSVIHNQLKSPTVQEYMLELMDSKGLTDEKLLSVLERGLDSKLVGLTRDGKAVNMGLDNNAIVRFLDLGFKLRNRFPNPRLDVEHNVTGAIVIRPEEALGIDPFSETIEGEYKHVKE